MDDKKLHRCFTFSEEQLKHLRSKKYKIDRMECFMSLVDLAEPVPKLVQISKTKQVEILAGQVMVDNTQLAKLWDKDRKTVPKLLDAMEAVGIFSSQEVEDLLFANKLVKHSKSNAITLVKNKQLCASGIGQTSRVDSLKQAIEKANSFEFDLKGAVMASDAFFPFPDCVEIADKAGITAVIQPGGSVNDKLSVDYCNEHGLAMVKTGVRHFKH